MAQRPKVFISFSNQDREIARRLHGDLQARGAEVFQFLEAARPGQPAWGQVAEAIEHSEWFLVLVTKRVSASKAVDAEIDLAFHTRVNSENQRPNLVPLMVEAASKPRLLKPQTELDFTSYDEGLGKLTALMELEAGEAPEVAEDERPLHVTLEVSPARPTVGKKVRWKAKLENRGARPLKDAVARLGGAVVGGPADLAPGQQVRYEAEVVYASTGKRRRRLVATASISEGLKVEATAVGTVSIAAGPGGSAASASSGDTGCMIVGFALLAVAFYFARAYFG